MKDTDYNFTHFTNPNQGLYTETWREESPIPYDDIDTTALFEATANLFPQFLLEDEEDGAIPINSANFSAKYYKNKRLLKDKVWLDTAIFERFLNQDQVADNTILKPIAAKPPPQNFNTSYDTTQGDDLTIAQFLLNGYGPETLDILGNDLNDSLADVSSEYFSSRRQGSYGSHTPRVGRRQPSFHTPI